MEKSFATLDKEASSSGVHDCLNSTALNEEGVLFVPPKTPQRDDIKISPIPRDEGRNAFHKRMAQFKSRGESPLAKPKSRNSSLLEASHNSNESESGYNSHSQENHNEAVYESSSKENHPYKTPKRVRNESYQRNPFDSRLLENIHTSAMFSPNLMEVFPSPKDKPWSIDHMSILFPANITDEEIRMSREITDPEFEEKVQQRLEIYWQSGVGYIASPEGPRPIIFDSPAVMSMPSSTISTRKREESPSGRPLLDRRRTITLRNFKAQTDLTIPPSADLDLAKILGEHFIYQEDDNPESQEDEFNISLNSSLPRRLFQDTSFMDDESFAKENDEGFDNIREDLDNSVLMQSMSQSPTKPSTLGLALDFSPIRGD